MHQVLHSTLKCLCTDYCTIFWWIGKVWITFRVMRCAKNIEINDIAPNPLKRITKFWFYNGNYHNIFLYKCRNYVEGFVFLGPIFSCKMNPCCSESWIKTFQCCNFWAHLCNCMVGSYALLSVCLSASLGFSVQSAIYRSYQRLMLGHILCTELRQAGQVEIRVLNRGRWAHINVKLLHYIF